MFRALLPTFLFAFLVACGSKDTVEHQLELATDLPTHSAICGDHSKDFPGQHDAGFCQEVWHLLTRGMGRAAYCYSWSDEQAEWCTEWHPECGGGGPSSEYFAVGSFEHTRDPDSGRWSTICNCQCRHR